jgi:outer membrane protein OmpA-like peptidoglycan-associated protein
MKKIQCCFVVVAIALISCQIGFAKEKLTAQDWLQRGIEFERQNVHEEAIKMYTNAVTTDKNYSEAYFRRAKAYMASHKSNAMEALTDFNRAIALDPTNAEAYYERGLLHAFILNNENARNDMRTAANLGHKGAKQWLAPDPEEKGKRKESAYMSAAAVTSREEDPKSLAADMEEKSNKRGGRNLDLSEYLSSKSEPMIHFDFNMSTIKEQYHAILDEIALVLKEKLPEANIILAGHTDSTGTEKYNDYLSLRRAKAVESYLIERHDIPPDRIIVKGYGESAPIAPNETEEGQARNRRVELLVTGK